LVCGGELQQLDRTVLIAAAQVGHLIEVKKLEAANNEEYQMYLDEMKDELAQLATLKQQVATVRVSR
jgi:hypothetical protein